MSSMPLRYSSSAPGWANARSKPSSTGSSAVTSAAPAFCRASCCSRSIRLRKFSKSAWRRRSWSKRIFFSSSSFFSCSCAAGVSAAAGAAASTSGAWLGFFSIGGGESVLREQPVEERGHVGDSGDGAGVVHARRPQQAERARPARPLPVAGADEGEVFHRRRHLLQANLDTRGGSGAFQAVAQQARQALFFFQGGQQGAQRFRIGRLHALDQVRDAFQLQGAGLARVESLLAKRGRLAEELAALGRYPALDLGAEDRKSGVEG